MTLKRLHSSQLNAKTFMALSQILLYSLFASNVVFSNIIDTKFPIVIHDNGRTNGQNDFNHNYFGYSLAFLKGYMEDKSPSQTHNARSNVTIFIGAPNETRSSTKNSGVVWQCKFNGGSAQVSCSILKSISEQQFNTTSKNRSCDQQRSKATFSEKETEQWIGASLSVNPTSRQLLSCAPRWKRNGYYRKKNCYSNKTQLPGACYLASQNGIELLNPFSILSPSFYDNKKLYHPYGEFGFSSHFTESGKLVVGAPATRKTGVIVEVSPMSNEMNNSIIHQNIAGIEINSLNGYSVTSGRIPKGYYIASGAPRAKGLYGAVTVSHPSKTIPFAIFNGEQFGSYFGYALATVDLNGDGYDEVLVGAPWYSQNAKSSESLQNGCVLIFDLQQLEKMNITKHFEPKLCMETQIGFRSSRFGSAITKIPDINFDLYDDFAVSAPYDDDGKGTVFIYHGGYPLSNKPAQVIRGRLLGIGSLRGLGTYLLSGKEVDIDGNATPDLILGAFESRHVVVLRSRPIAKASIKISFHTNESTGSQGEIMKYLPNQQIIRVRSCIIFNVSVDVPSGQSFDVRITFELGLKIKQVSFDKTDDHLEQIHKLQPLWEDCIDKRLRVVEIIDTSSTEDLIEFRVRYKYDQTETSENQPVQHANVPLSLPSSIGYTQAYKSFNPYLPIPIPPTYSEWGQLPVAMDNCDTNGNPICESELKIQTKLFYEKVMNKNSKEKLNNGSQTLVAGQLDILELQIEVSNLQGKETAYNPTVLITLSVSENFNMNATMLTLNWDIEGKLGRCKPFNGTVPNEVTDGATITTLGQTCFIVIQPGNKLTTVLKIGNWGHLRVSDGDRGEMTLKVEAFPEQNPSQSGVENFRFPLEANVSIEVKSSVPDQSEISPELLQSGFVDISQYYIITNTGFSETTREAVTAEILVPTHFNFSSSDNNWTQIIWVANPSILTNTSTANILCTADNHEFFTLFSQDTESEQNSSAFLPDTNGKEGNFKSDTMTMPPEMVSLTDSSDKFITFSGCEGNSEIPPELFCQKITCKMDLQPRASAPKEIRLPLYISGNALRDLVDMKANGIRVKSKITVFYLGREVAQKVGVTERTLFQVKGISALILLGAGGGGIIPLILIIVVLYKCGFFQRKYNDELKRLIQQQIVQEDQEEIIQLASTSRGSQQNELTL